MKAAISINQPCALVVDLGRNPHYNAFTRLVAGDFIARYAFIAIDANGAVIDWNEQAHVIFGWSRQEVIGELLADLIYPIVCF